MNILQEKLPIGFIPANRGFFSSELAAKMGDRVFGCDECVKVCPYDLPCNSAERVNKELKFYPDRRYLDLEEVSGWQEDQFEEFFADSTIKRTGLERLKRNAKLCLKNDGCA